MIGRPSSRTARALLAQQLPDYHRASAWGKLANVGCDTRGRRRQSIAGDFMKTRTLCSAVCVLWLASSAGAQSHAKVVDDGVTRVAMEYGRSKIVAEVQTTRLGPSDKAYPGRAGTTAGQIIVMSGLRLSVAGEELAVARSVFADLIDPLAVRFKGASMPFVLAVTCGDGAESTIVEITFDRSYVHKRRVFSTLDTRQPVQETTYRLLELK